MTGSEYFYSRLPLFIMYVVLGVGVLILNAALLRHERRAKERSDSLR